MAQEETVIVKFRRVRSETEQQRSIRDIAGADLERAERVFGDADEPDLATVYEVRVRPSGGVQRLLESFRGDSEVEYAHVPPERKPG